MTGVQHWVRAFNEHLQAKHKRHTIDYEWYDELKIWLPQNVKHLMREDARCLNPDPISEQTAA
jgi:hypothetical protein